MSVSEVLVGVVVDHLDVLAGDDEGVVVILVINHHAPSVTEIIPELTCCDVL